MTEREKIIEVVKKAFEDCGQMLKEQIPRVLSGEIKKASDGTPPLDEAIADALIAAGLRFAFTSDFASDTQKAYKEGYLKGEEESKAEIALAKAFHDEKCAEYELVCYKLQKAEHLAKVARRALKIAVSEYSRIKGNENATSALTYDYLQQAERELAEEGKDD